MPLDPNIPLSVRPVQAPDPYAALDYALRARQQERLEQAAQLETDRIAEERAKQQEAGQARQQLNAIMREAFTPSVDGTAPSLDRTKIQERLAASGQWHLWPSIAPHLDEVDKSAQQAKKLGEEVARLQQQAEGAKAKGMAAIAYGVHLAGDTPEALLLGAAQAKAHGWATDDDLEPYLEAAQQDPSKVPMITSQLIGLSPDYAALLTRERKPAEPGKVPDVGTFPDYAMRAARERGVALEALSQADIQGLRASYQASAAAASEPGGAKAGSFEDYVERLARERGVSPAELKTADIEQARKRYQQSDDRPRISVSTGGGISPTAEANVINRLTNQWSKATEPARELRRQVGLMDAGLEAARKGDRAQGAQAVLVTFQKILDPTSVVRESEYARSASGLSLLQRIRGAAEQVAVGGANMPLAELEKFAALARQMATEQTKYLGGVERRIKSTADRYKIPHELVVDESIAAAPDAGAATAPSGGGVAGLSYQDYLASRKKKP